MRARFSDCFTVEFFLLGGAPGSSSGSAAQAPVSTIVKLTGRSTRASSSEKSAPLTGAVPKKPALGLSGERKSPVGGTSAANSPKKPPTSKGDTDKDMTDRSDDSEDLAADDKGPTAAESEQAKPSTGLRVPPLKIVLTSSNNSLAAGKDGGSKTLQTSGGGSSNYEDSKKGLVSGSNSQGTASDSDSNNPAAGGGGADTDKSETVDAPSGASGGNDGEAKATSHASRVTRSRANQGTPGPQV